MDIYKIISIISYIIMGGSAVFMLAYIIGNISKLPNKIITGFRGNKERKASLHYLWWFPGTYVFLIIFFIFGVQPNEDIADTGMMIVFTILSLLTTYDVFVIISVAKNEMNKMRLVLFHRMSILILIVLGICYIAVAAFRLSNMMN